MNTTPADTTTADHLDQQAAAATALAAAARLQAAVAADAVEAKHAERDREFRTRRVQAFDRLPLHQEETRARRAFHEALQYDPLVQSFIDWQAARLWTHHAAHQANTDAELAGLPPVVPGLGHTGPTADEFHEALGREVSHLILERLQTMDSQHGEAAAEYVLGDDRPRAPEEHMAREAEQERRRRAARAVIGPAPINVEGMTEAERARRGLPPGR